MKKTKKVPYRTPPKEVFVSIDRIGPHRVQETVADLEKDIRVDDADFPEHGPSRVAGPYVLEASLTKKELRRRLASLTKGESR